ncbi:UDP-N-acetylglucosamine 2-epimerase [Paenibacillus puldeungensis]|uniref:UDP-N-acetylglucosamine 2-epimerase n=1 Tax=Paenibacillus puldeungensis TaxID=696536 RepID=A0ABW3S2Z0_9BACL
MKKVMVVTGTRADYGIYFPILKKIEEDSDLELQILVTGMHLTPKYGNTVKYIEADGFQIAAKVTAAVEASRGGMARGIGEGIIGMTEAFESLKPDCVIVLGDRGEMLAATISSVYLNIPTLHLHGGEVSGSIDESVRHAISKLAHLHLTATTASKERLIKMGEDPWRVYVVGAPRIEAIESAVLPDIQSVKRKYHLDFAGIYGLFIYHPVTTDNQSIEKELECIFKAVSEEKIPYVCVMPNSDAGSEEIINFYNNLSEKDGFYKIVTFEQYDYLSILKHAYILVGNSSSGIIEAASFKVPVINIGSRQYRRERSQNTIDVSVDYNQIRSAFSIVKSTDFKERLKRVKNVYYKKNTSQSVVEIIHRLNDYGDELTQKTISY